MKELSCGVLLKHGDSFLLCHATGKNYWDIPKGRQDQGESYIETACRELQEETGVIIDPNTLRDIGGFEYIPKKDLYLFWTEQSEKCNTFQMKCSSFFEVNGKSIPECDAFAYVKFKDLHRFVTKNMYKVLSKVINESLD